MELFHVAAAENFTELFMQDAQHALLRMRDTKLKNTVFILQQQSYIRIKMHLEVYNNNKIHPHKSVTCEQSNGECNRLGDILQGCSFGSHHQNVSGILPPF